MSLEERIKWLVFAFIYYVVFIGIGSSVVYVCIVLANLKDGVYTREQICRTLFFSFLAIMLVFKVYGTYSSLTSVSIPIVIPEDTDIDIKSDRPQAIPTPLQPSVIPLVNNLVSPLCIYIPPEVITRELSPVMAQGGIKHKFLGLRNITDTLKHYLIREKYQAICAIDVGKPLCYCMLHSKSTDTIVSLFNMNITATSKVSVIQEEFSHFCTETEIDAHTGQTLRKKIPNYVPRAQTVKIEYHNRDGKRIAKEFSGSDSFILQQIWDINHNKLPCNKRA